MTGLISRDQHGVPVFSVHPAGAEVGLAYVCPVKGPCCSGHEGSRLMNELLRLREGLPVAVKDLLKDQDLVAVLKCDGREVAEVSLETLREAWDRKVWELRVERDELRARVAEIEALINTPATADWLEAVRLEAAHQTERWGPGPNSPGGD